MKKRRNIQFSKGHVKYNAIRKFDDDIVKIPSYVVNEVFRKKGSLKIFHQGKLKAHYTWENLKHYIRRVEKKEYEGKFRLQDITYRLNWIQI